MRRVNIRIVDDLDDLVKQQQQTLEQAGLPGFMATKDKSQVRIQMHLLDFVKRLADEHK